MTFYEESYSNTGVCCSLFCCRISVKVIAGLLYGNMVSRFAQVIINASWVYISLVWGVLYLLMGISAGLVWSMRTLYSWLLTILFVVQLIINLAWSFTFFWMKSPVAGLVVLVLLFVCVVLYVVGCYKQSRAAALMNIPYVVWLLYAMFLNSYIVMNN